MQDIARCAVGRVGRRVCALAVVLCVLWPGAAFAVPAAFAEKIDLEAIRLVAVQDGGRIKTFDSLAREVLYELAHTEHIDGQDPVLTYLDLMLDPQAYHERDIIHIGKHALREAIVRALSNDLSAVELARIEKKGLVSPEFLDREEVRRVLITMSSDVMRFYGPVSSIMMSRRVCEGEPLRHRWTIVPPPGGKPVDPWHHGDAVWGHLAPNDAAHAGVGPTGQVPGLAPETAAQMNALWAQLSTAWKGGDATQASTALNDLAALLPTIEPTLYPSVGKRAIERWYISGTVLFWSNNKLTWVWVVYLIAFVLLLMAFVYGWRRARMAGLAFFGLAFALHTVGVGIRWYLQGRIPNANMFEAVMMSVWFGAGVCIVLEVIFRRSAMRNLFLLAGASVSVFALMAGYFIPVTLGASMSVMMPVLDTIWLRIHTNLIISSYALIGIATITAIVTLVRRMVTAPSPRLFVGLGVPTIFFVVGMSDAMGWSHAFSREESRLIGAVLSVTTPFALIFLPAMAIRLVRTVFPAIMRATVPQVALAGAGNVGGGATGDTHAGRSTKSSDALTGVLDGATMILMQLAMMTLWVGLILGAVWADVSWGRPWGWDPKEVFALSTFIIFLILVHVRLKVRDKPFWTAMLCVVGCSVMLFNWVAINFVITGLHSYAA